MINGHSKDQTASACSDTYPIIKKFSAKNLFCALVGEGGTAFAFLYLAYFLRHDSDMGIWVSLLVGVGVLLAVCCFIGCFTSIQTFYRLVCPHCGREITIAVGTQACNCPLCTERLIFAENRFHTAKEVVKKQGEK